MRLEKVMEFSLNTPKLIICICKKIFDHNHTLNDGAVTFVIEI